MNRKCRTFAWTALLLLGLVAAAGAQEAIGEIVYLEPGVAIVRGGRTLEDVDFGAEVENFDLLRTDRTGFAEVQLTSPRAPATTIKVSPGTSFTFEINTAGQANRTTVGLLSGSLSMKVQKITGSRAVDVRTESAVMGIRGTEFQVFGTPAGDLLVTANEGRVSCLDDSGTEAFAQPGQAVEKLAGEPMRAIPVAVSDLETFRREWMTERIEAFKPNALRAIRAYSTRYMELYDRFNRAYDNLMSHEVVLRKWIREDRQNTTGGRMEIMREKKELVGDLLEIRKVLFIFERIYFRLQELQEYHGQGYGAGEIRPGLSTANFFRSFAGQAADLEEMMSQVRYVTRMYADRNDGSFPTDAFGGSFSQTTEFEFDSDFTF